MRFKIKNHYDNLEIGKEKTCMVSECGEVEILISSILSISPNTGEVIDKTIIFNLEDYELIKVIMPRNHASVINRILDKGL